MQEKEDMPLEKEKKEQQSAKEAMEELQEALEEIDCEEQEGEILSSEEKKIQELTEKLTEQLDKYQRTLAEFDNFRKRTSREKASMYDDGVRDTVEKLLPVIDNLERAMKAKEQEGNTEDGLYAGIKMVYKQWMETLAAMGVSVIPAEGEKFDPALHAAVAHEESEEYGENTIMLEMLKGYRHKEKVIRHSMVKVAN